MSSSVKAALLASATHPSEILALIRYKFVTADKTMYKTLAEVPPKGSPDYTRAMCYYFLNYTSRSFARVIQELDPELRHPVCIFYLVLRGLDTVEDDMTLKLDRKVDLLKSFYKVLTKKGWTFSENGEQEKDRVLLEDFDVVIDEFLGLKESYQKVIADICRRMGEGMADFVAGKKVVTIEDYNLYTHYVAGLVGLGLTGLFVASGLENPALAQHEKLANEMGLFLQKVNILKDYLQDLKEGRLFWPETVWKKYVPEGQGVEALAKPENLDRALATLNHLCGDALDLVPSCLEYMSMLREPSVFQFCAIPQMMALASIDHFFNNPALFQKSGNKIRRGLAVQLIEKSTDMESVKDTYYQYALKLNKKNGERVGTNDFDDSFMRVSLACGRIVRWIQVHDKERGLVRKQPGGNSAMLAFLIVILAILLAFSYLPTIPLTPREKTIVRQNKKDGKVQWNHNSFRGINSPNLTQPKVPELLVHIPPVLYQTLPQECVEDQSVLNALTAVCDGSHGYITVLGQLMAEPASRSASGRYLCVEESRARLRNVLEW
ncbi:bifunctional farnesyl-diphosphate farnesyltransferase/squalene synthase [Borealophlyctis nickersoniae]|nr:bifunctional farnesyl-diphosphate farnesyltransferase/squalene synthase [Borealophlyctis nickersoniae]